MNKSRRIDQKEYHSFFKKNKRIHKEALKQSYEIRKFEIELYWKRATYFWTFIGTAFVAYGVFYNAQSTVNTQSNSEREFILVLIACVGLVFSVAWHCVNKGSKFWQENWENHVELLEDNVFGPLYKTRTQRPPDRKFPLKDRIEDFFVAPSAFSVSKINQLVSTFMAIIWGMLLCHSVGDLCISECEADFKKIVPIILAITTCTGFWFIGISHGGSHNPQAYTRSTSVSSEDSSIKENKDRAFMKDNLEILFLAIALLWVLGSIYASLIYPEGNWFCRSGAIMVLLAAIVEFRLGIFLNKEISDASDFSAIGSVALINYPKRKQQIGTTAHIFAIFGTLIWEYGDLIV